MNKQEAIAAVTAVVENFPGATKFYVTTDAQVFIKSALGIAHAVTLSPGNPQLEEVETAELDVQVPPAKSAEELAAEKTAEDKKVLEGRVSSLKAEILKLDDGSEITEENTKEKLHLAQLNEDLEAAEEELKNFI